MTDTNDPLPPWQEPQVNQVTLAHPWRWLAKGWQDILAAPVHSLRYGAVIVVISALIVLLTVVGHLTFLVPFLSAGFFLMAPLLAVGLYQMSAHLERGEPLANCQALEAVKRNQAQLGMATGFLFMIMQLWILASVFLFIMLFDAPLPTWENFIPVVVLSGKYTTLVVAVVLVGAFFALCGLRFLRQRYHHPDDDRPAGGWLHRRADEFSSGGSQLAAHAPVGGAPGGHRRCGAPDLLCRSLLGRAAGGPCHLARLPGYGAARLLSCVA